MSNRTIVLTAAAVLSATGLPATAVAGASTTTVTTTNAAPSRFADLFAVAGTTTRTAPAPSSVAVTVPPRVHAMTAASGAPAVASRTPARNATGVARATNVRIRFTKAVKASTIRIRMRDAVTGAAIPGTLTYKSSTRTATFNPTPTLGSHRRYIATVSGAKTSAGYVMTTSTWAFTTRP